MTMDALKECRILVTPTTYGRDDPRLRTELEAAVGEIVYNPHPRLRTGHNLALEFIAISRQQALDEGRQIAMLFDMFAQNRLGGSLIDQTP